MTPRTERLLILAIDAGERAFCLLLFALFLSRQWGWFQVKPYNLISVFSELLVVVFVLVRRRPQSFSSRPLDWLVALAGTSLPLLAVSGRHPLVPAELGSALMTAGLLLSVWAKLSLRRSFGIAAANRGVVCAGPYRFVRHPMYAGYALVHLGFFLMNPVPWNLGLYAAVWTFQVARIVVEEKLLLGDPAYELFSARVRYRLAPGLF